jgi:hypothetical protein
VAVTRLSGGNTPADGADPRTFPAIWNGTADDLEAGEYSKVPSGGSAGEVLVKQSATDYDSAWTNLDPYSQFPHILLDGLSTPQGYIPVNSVGTGSLTPGNNEMQFCIIRVPAGTKVNRLRTSVLTAGSANSFVRMGLYEPVSRTDPTPGALVYESVPASAATTGTKSFTSVNVQSAFGWLWCAIVVQTDDVVPVMRGLTVTNQIVGQGNSEGAFLLARFIPRRYGITGALPDPSGFTTWVSGGAATDITGNTMSLVFYDLAVV